MQKYAIEMGGVSRYFSKVSGSGVALTLLKERRVPVCPGHRLCRKSFMFIGFFLPENLRHLCNTQDEEMEKSLKACRPSRA